MSRPRGGLAGTTAHLFLFLSLAASLTWLPALAAGSPSPGVCTRLPSAPEYPLPLLGEFETREQVRGDLDRDGTPDLLLLTRRNTRYANLWRIRYHGEEPLEFQLLLELAPSNPEGEKNLGPILFGDFDGDGRGDLVIVWKSKGAGIPSLFDLYLGQENGELVAAETLEFSSPWPPEVAAGDFDGDGIDELAAMKRYYYYSVLRLEEYEPGQGWSESMAKLVAGSGVHLTAGDIDGDGIEDVLHVASSASSRSLIVHFGDPLSPLVRSRSTSLGPSLIGMLTTLGQPGTPAQVVYHDKLFWPSPTHWLVGMKFSPDRGLTRQWRQPLPLETTTEPEAWDVDLDGTTDLVFEVNEADPSTLHPSGSGFAIYLGRMDGPFVPSFRTEAPGRLMDLKRIDDDEMPDAVVLEAPSSWTFYRGLPGLNFDDGFLFDPLPERVIQYTLKSADLDGDGLQDIVMMPDGQPVWLRNLDHGDFEEHRLEELPPAPSYDFRVEDIDGDSLIDIAVMMLDSIEERYTLWTAWGVGDGEFTPWRPLELPGWVSYFFLADLDGNGHEDLLLLSPKGIDARFGYHVEGYLGESRTFAFADAFELPPFYYYRFALGDIDGVGGEEFLYTAENPATNDDDMLLMSRTWRPGRGFSEPWLTFPHGVSLSSSGATMAVDDLDGDGHNDLALRVDGDIEGGVLRTLRGDGAGHFSILWRGAAEGEWPRPRIYFADLDYDGFLDAVETTPYPYTKPFRVWRGDGTGGFLDAGRSFYGSTTDKQELIGRFTGSIGEDLLHPAKINGRRFLVLNPQRVRPLDRDIAPPSLKLLLAPNIDDFIDPPAFERRWRINGLVRDECGSAAVTEIRLNLAPIPPDAPLAYLPAAEDSIRLYEAPATGEVQVVLRGPEEGALRDLFARARQEGGFHLERNQLVELTTHDEFGRSPSSMGDEPAVPPSFRLTAHYRLIGETLDAAAIRRPGADISFFLRAEDHVGKRAEATGSYRQEREKYCGSAGASPRVCRTQE